MKLFQYFYKDLESSNSTRKVISRRLFDLYSKDYIKDSYFEETFFSKLMYYTIAIRLEYSSDKLCK